MALIIINIDRIHTVIMRMKVAGFRIICYSVRSNLLVVEGTSDLFINLLSAPFDGVESVEMVGAHAEA